MDYFCHTVTGNEVHLYPIVCWHLGVRQSDGDFIRKVIRTIDRDPLGRWIYMGDMGECNLKSSKGDVYSQLISPGEQLEQGIALLQPIKDKGLFGINGNHPRRIYRETGLDWDKQLCARVGIPYLGTSALGNIFFDPTGRGKGDHSISLYAHHGTSGAISPAGKTAAAKKPEQIVDADIILTAHSHACGELICPKHSAYTDPRSREIRWKTSRSFLCGSGYDSRVGYAEEKMYPPILPEHLMIRVRMVRKTVNEKDRRVLSIVPLKITSFPGDIAD